jgi:hypothetical protein
MAEAQVDPGNSANMLLKERCGMVWDFELAPLVNFVNERLDVENFELTMTSGTIHVVSI